MKACILAYKHIYQSKKHYLQLIEHMNKRFNSVQIIPIEKVVMDTNRKIELKYRNKPLDDFDVILPRIGPSYIPYGMLILKHLQEKTYFPNKPEAYNIASNKFHTLMVLQRNNLPVPRTILTISRELAKLSLEKVGEPVVIKRLGKSGGKGVVYAKDIKSATTFLDAIPMQRGEQILIEEYIENPGEDIRLFVIGDEVAACMKRIARKSDIRSNIHAGGKGVKFLPTDEMKKNAVKAAKVIGADICGVDMIVGPDGPQIIECNMNPGFAIAEITGVNLFQRVTDFIYKQALLFHKGEDMSFLDKIGSGFRNMFKQMENKMD
jgi:ribosomal protein S6--L-glutamate ligase